MKDFVAIDFETATRDMHSACSFAAVKVTGGIISECHNWLFKPPGNIYDPGHMAIHGITPEMTDELHDIRGVYKEICELIKDHIVVAHNADFDMSVLRASMLHYGYQPPSASLVVCTLKLTGKGLAKCCQEYNIPLTHHDAMSDALACAKLYLLLQNRQLKTIERNRIVLNASSRNRKPVIVPAEIPKELRSSVFYGKRVVITGVFEKYPDRHELIQKLTDFGSRVTTSISGSTDIVIMGVGAGPRKIEKIKELNSIGSKPIRVIHEKELEELL